MNTPRGIRNHNPGNIVRNGVAWQGLADDQSSDPRFAVFEAPVWGLRALCHLLLTYYDHHHLCTLSAIVHRWAPPHENDTGAYVDHLSQLTGFGRATPLNLHDQDVLIAVAKAIVQHENGQDPYDDVVYFNAAKMAGVGNTI